MGEVFVVFHSDAGRVPLYVFRSSGAARRWCVADAEKRLMRKKHPRAGVRPVREAELEALGYDIWPCPEAVRPLSLRGLLGIVRAALGVA